MTNVFIVLAIILILACSITKIVIDKRKGIKCVGCPYSQSNNSNCDCNCNSFN